MVMLFRLLSYAIAATGLFWDDLGLDATGFEYLDVLVFAAWAQLVAVDLKVSELERRLKA